MKHRSGIRDTFKALTPVTVAYGITEDVKCLPSKYVINNSHTPIQRNQEVFNGKPIEKSYQYDNG